MLMLEMLEKQEANWLQVVSIVLWPSLQCCLKETAFVMQIGEMASAVRSIDPQPSMLSEKSRREAVAFQKKGAQPILECQFALSLDSWPKLQQKSNKRHRDDITELAGEEEALVGLKVAGATNNNINVFRVPSRLTSSLVSKQQHLEFFQLLLCLSMMLMQF